MLERAALNYYQNLKDYYSFAKVKLGAKNLMVVDMLVSMPRGAFDQRMRDIDGLTLKIHEYLSAREVRKNLENCELDIEQSSQNSAKKSPENWEKWDKANVREMRRIYNNYAAVPFDLYRQIVRAESMGPTLQKKLIAKGDKAAAIEQISHVIDIVRQEADYKQKLYKTKSGYEALLKNHVYDISEAELDLLHDDIIDILKNSFSSKPPQWGQDIEQPCTALSKRDLMWLGTLLLQQLGFDFQTGRLIISRTQPFCGGTNKDARILVRCSDPPRFFTTLSDVLYQGARGLYMQHIPANWADQPVGSLSGMPTVDAASLLLENFIGSSPAFFQFLEKEIKTLPSTPSDETYRAGNLLKLKNDLLEKRGPGEPIRNFSDLYLNIIITKIEQDLIDGDLKVTEIEDRWISDLQQNFSLKPDEIRGANNALNFMNMPELFNGKFGSKAAQNISYLTAAQIHSYMLEDIMDFDHLIASGEFTLITQWLDKKLFSKAHSFTFKDLLHKSSDSSALRTDVLKTYIRDKAQ